MKKNINISLLFLASLLVIFMFHGCLKNDINTLVLLDETNRHVDITNPQDIQNALRIDQSGLVRKDLPQPTPGNNSLSVSIKSITVNSGSTLILPLIYTGGYSVLSYLNCRNYFVSLAKK